MKEIQKKLINGLFIHKWIGTTLPIMKHGDIDGCP
jgi:hypothetical protein